jgi:hypothetical protein
MIEVRGLAVNELGRAAEIDVKENGSVVLEQRGAAIRARPEEWHRPPTESERSRPAG